MPRYKSNTMHLDNKFNFFGFIFLIFALSACSENYEPCYNDGKIYQELGALLKDGNIEKMVERLLPLAEKGDRTAQHNVGFLLWKTQPEEAFKWNMQSAKQGCVEGVLGVAMAYREGYGVEKIPSKAYEWYLKAAKSGDKMAASTVASMIEKGEGVKKDSDKYFYWFEKSNASN